jgi:two-component system cell cycle response regulator
MLGFASATGRSGCERSGGCGVWTGLNRPGVEMPMLVLVVDDYASNVKLLEALLRTERHDVLTAFGGEEALAKIDQFNPDIVLLDVMMPGMLDVMMPGMNGYEVCSRIRQNPRTAGLPVIMVTALDKPSDRDMALAAGADDFMTKPIEMLKLFPMMRHLVEAGRTEHPPAAKAS